MPDPDRIARRLQELWEIAHGPGGGADRPAYSPAEAEAIALVAGWARDHDLEPGLDEHGNLWAAPAGWTGPLVTSGSHVDTVPDGGRYDGALGTVLGLELVADLAAQPTAGGARAGILVCAAEEAPRFGAGTVGSRLLAGTLSAPALAQLRDADGVTAAEARDGYLEALGELPRIEPPLDGWRAHAEVHVALRRELRRLGVVTRVAAPRRLRIQITGQAGHAGEVSMSERRDALAAAAEITLAIESAARAQPPETVATVGTLSISPGAISVIPARAVLGVDMRGIEGTSLDRLDGAIRGRVAEITRRRGVGAEIELLRDGQPVKLDPELVAAALEAARDRGITAVPTWSGSGHDAQHLSGLTRALLVFVPLHGGEGHTPQEGAEIGEIVAAGELTAAVIGAVGA